MWIFLAIVCGALLILLIANLTTSEKKIEREIQHLYSVRDPSSPARWERCWDRPFCRETA